MWILISIELELRCENHKIRAQGRKLPKVAPTNGSQIQIQICISANGLFNKVLWQW